MSLLILNLTGGNKTNKTLLYHHMHNDETIYNFTTHNVIVDAGSSEHQTRSFSFSKPFGSRLHVHKFVDGFKILETNAGYQINIV